MGTTTLDITWTTSKAFRIPLVSVCIRGSTHITSVEGPKEQLLPGTGQSQHRGEDHSDPNATSTSVLFPPHSESASPRGKWKQDFTMLASLVSNSWPQMLHPPQLLKTRSLYVAQTGLKLLDSKHMNIQP
ncbi:hypothetical protein AAY473_015243 [Plecturocebus cupreus]